MKHNKTICIVQALYCFFLTTAAPTSGSWTQPRAGWSQSLRSTSPPSPTSPTSATGTPWSGAAGWPNYHLDAPLHAHVKWIIWKLLQYHLTFKWKIFVRILNLIVPVFFQAKNLLIIKRVRVSEKMDKRNVWNAIWIRKWKNFCDPEILLQHNISAFFLKNKIQNH